MIPARKHAIVEVILMLVVLAMCLVSTFKGLEFSNTADISVFIDAPPATDTIPRWVHSMLIYFAAPVVISLVSCTSDQSLVHVVMSYLCGVLLASTVSNIASDLISLPRPDTRRKCNGVSHKADCSSVLPALELLYQFRSLPSVETAEAFASSLFISELLTEEWKTDLLVLLPLKIAPVVYSFASSVLSIMDHKNSPVDVAFGVVIGVAIGSVSYHTSRKETNTHKQTIRDLSMSDSVSSATLILSF